MVPKILHEGEGEDEALGTVAGIGLIAQAIIARLFTFSSIASPALESIERL